MWIMLGKPVGSPSETCRGLLMKRGIVLEGGGAKGAYQVGCLRAVLENNIAIHAISGTSVGGLNGTLLAYDRLADGENYWRNLSVRSVLKARWRWLPLSPLFMLHIASYKLFSPVTKRMFYFISTYFLAMTVLFAILPYVDPSYDDSYEEQTGIGHWVWVGILALSYFAMLVVWTAFTLLRRARFSLFEPEPLRAFVTKIVAAESRTILSYVTLTEQSFAFDPDQPRLFYWKRDDTLVWGAVEGEYAFPRYIRLDTLDIADRIKATLASAALPVGIFPSVSLNDVTYVDGGVADNLPLYPLIEYERCDELIVVALRPWTHDALKTHWQHVNRVMRLDQLSQSDAQRLYFAELEQRGGDRRHAEPFEPPVNLPLIQPQFWPERLILICPDRPLGGFLTGTMRFSRRYANRLILRGYLDANTALEAAGLSRT